MCLTHHQKEAEGIGEGGGAGRFESAFDLEAARGENDGGRDPETTVG